MKNRLNYKQFINIINKEEFIKYYSTHNIFITANYYNTIPQVIINYCKNIGYKKDKVRESIELINKEEIQNYYSSHTYQETLIHFNLTPYLLSRMLKLYNINKR